MLVVEECHCIYDVEDHEHQYIHHIMALLLVGLNSYELCLCHQAKLVQVMQKSKAAQKGSQYRKYSPAKNLQLSWKL
jgi:hypothetical protein